ncbi:MAG: preprotein translocase subunit SecG [Candidatus Fischerbacteria bacterium RBG_13_37_8]|uniref:Protein-export membrane protein SecG n=1 Tax=Candidatus Fischerbacteria bacterium RBG_13_37_8 TaxID=1817863 RepID=A0A1F5VPF3_9BACT|nr:MAG: preprotein translocase subunit SecG [Candidatus Fischerbacteria bacterium RBG_13_37_8]
MLITIITIMHVILALIVIVAVLLQSGKGTDIAGVFGGGGGSSAFGPTGAATLFWKITGVAFALFLLSSTVLSILHTKRDMPAPLKGIERKVPQTPQPPTQ